MGLNCGYGLPTEIEEKVCEGVWTLIVEDAQGISGKKRLVTTRRESKLHKPIKVEVVKEDDSDYVDALNHLPVSNCNIL